MAYSADQAAFQVQERLKALYRLVHDIHEERQRSEHNLNSIEKAHDKISTEERVSSHFQQQLKSLYTDAVADAEREEELIRKALTKVNEIRTIRNERRIQSSAQTLPLWVGKPGEKAPPLCGAIPMEASYIAKPGDMVAALVKGAEEEEDWILAEVVSYNTSTGRYEVDDIDEEQKDRHVLSRRRVMPLPLMRANPETDHAALFPKESVVMALYPQTTCFYKALVNALPTTASEEYEVLFDDPSYAEGYSPPLPVAQRYVLAIRDRKGHS